MINSKVVYGALLFVKCYITMMIDMTKNSACDVE